MRKTITAEQFISLVRQGDCRFQDVDIIGVVDFGNMEIEWMYLDHVRFNDDVIGSLTVAEISIHSDMCVYVAYNGTAYAALTYAGSLLKELNN